MMIQMIKKCVKCKNYLALDSFCKNKSRKDGLHSECRSCVKEYALKNKECISKRYKEYVVKNKDRIAKTSSDYRTKNKDTLYKKRLARLKTESLNSKLAARLRSRIYKVTVGTIKTGSAIKDLGCTVDQFRKYLEQQFKPNMSWGNYGKFGWHIDHIVPLAHFDLIDRNQFLKACHYTNLQPLWAIENLKKSSKVEQL